MNRKVFFIPDDNRKTKKADWMELPYLPKVGSIYSPASFSILPDGVYIITEVQQMKDGTVACFVRPRPKTEYKNLPQEGLSMDKICRK